MTAPVTAPAAPVVPQGRLDSLDQLPAVLQGWRREFVVSLLFNILCHVGASAAAGGAAWAVSTAVVHRGDDSYTSALVLATVVVLIATVTRSLSLWGESYASHDLAFRVLARIRLWIFDGISRLAPTAEQRRQGDLASTAMNDSEVLEIFFAHSSIYSLSRWLTTPLLLLPVALISWPVALVTLPFLALAWLVPTVTRRLAERHGNRARTALASLASDMQEATGALREVSAFGLLGERRRRLNEMQDEIDAAQRLQVMRAAAESTVSGIAVAALTVASLAVAVAEHSAGRLDLPLIPVVVALAGVTPAAILQWAATSRHTGNVSAAARRVEGIVQADDPLPAQPPGVPSPAPAALELEGLSFRWPGATRITIDDVSLRVPGGQTVALAGRSGSGKSTLAQLVARWFDADAGTVRIDGRDVRELSGKALTDTVRLIPQEPYLFADTVRDNLVLATEREVHDDELWQVLGQVGAADLVRRYPDGLDHLITDRGRSLSGGERQRLALARILIQRPRVVVLDEAVSQLDGASGARLDEALQHPDTTTIVIAHRLDTLLRAERIVVMEAGRIVGDGTHAELLERCPDYASLVGPQLLETPDHTNHEEKP